MMNTTLNIQTGTKLEVLRETTRDWNSANQNPLNFSKKFRTFINVKGDELADIVFSLTG